jgi:hypothetical protein
MNALGKKKNSDKSSRYAVKKTAAVTFYDSTQEVCGGPQLKNK